MLYNNFIVCIMTCAVFALLHMMVNYNYTYIILPIGILIWGVFKFFDADDRKYLESMGINPDEFNAFFPEWSEGLSYSDYGTYRDIKSSSPKVNEKKNTITWDSPTDHIRKENPSTATNAFGNFARGGFYNPRSYNDSRYKAIAKKCKRNFNISIE